MQGYRARLSVDGCKVERRFAHNTPYAVMSWEIYAQTVKVGEVPLFRWKDIEKRFFVDQRRPRPRPRDTHPTSIVSTYTSTELKSKGASITIALSYDALAICEIIYCSGVMLTWLIEHPSLCVVQ